MLLQTIEEKILQAMRDKKEPDLSILRLVKTAIKNREIELRKTEKEISEDEMQKVLKTQVKQLKDALQEFESAGREDLISKTKLELEVLKDFLPQEMPEQEIRGIISSVIEQSEEPSVNKCMGLVMKQVSGRADGNYVRELLTEMIG